MPFEEVDVECDRQAALKMVRKTGQIGVPVLEIGSRWIVGFDRQAIDRELGLRAS